MPAIDIPLEFPASYDLREGRKGAGLVILLHGYAQRGASMTREVGGCFPEDVTLLAPNAPFPVANRTPRGFRMGFAWYFYDPNTQVYGIDMSFATRYITALVKTLGFENEPKWVLGYSQGGYLAPFVGLALTDTKQCIGVNSRYRDEVLEKAPFRMDAIHGDGDKMVEPGRSEACHAALMEKGNEGAFHLIADTGHEINDAMRAKIREIRQA